MKPVKETSAHSIKVRDGQVEFVISNKEDSPTISIVVRIKTTGPEEKTTPIQGRILFDTHTGRIQTFSPKAYLPEIQLFWCLSIELITLIKLLLASNMSQAQIITALISQLGGTLPTGAMQCLNGYFTNLIS